MNKIILAATVALFVSGIVPAQAATNCNDQYRDFWDKVTQDGGLKTMSGERLADISRKSIRAYDACQAGDEFSLHGVWDQLEKDRAAQAKTGK